MQSSAATATVALRQRTTVEDITEHRTTSEIPSSSGLLLLTVEGCTVPPAVPHAGPKTVFFYAPLVKWGLVMAGMADMARPADKLSASQSGVLCLSGFIWSRYTLVIIPRTWALFAVNFFVGCCGTVQLGRIWVYRQSLGKTGEALAEIEDSG
ncbi:mitochondrial pyruvate carrier 2-like isoform X2 [Lampetra planeri]